MANNGIPNKNEELMQRTLHQPGQAEQEPTLRHIVLQHSAPIEDAYHDDPRSSHAFHSPQQSSASQQCPFQLDSDESRNQTSRHQLGEPRKPNEKFSLASRTELAELELNNARVDFSIWNEKIYSREQEASALRSSYRRCVAAINEIYSSHLELILVTGPSGTGKTSLAIKTLKPEVEKAGGFFIMGKFDQLERPENCYDPLVQSLSGLVRQVVARQKLQNDSKTYEKYYKAVHQVAEMDRLLLDLVPELQRFLESNLESAKSQNTMNDPVVDPKGAGAQERLTFALRQWLRLVCSPKQPVVLFLDDLQWAQPCTLHLLAAVVSDATIKGLCLVGACRGSEVALDHPLSVMLRELESNDVPICEIGLGALTVDAVQSMIGDIFEMSDVRSRQLAELTHRETEGNIFFVVQFIRSLTEEGLLYRDPDTCQWVWADEITILDRLECDNDVVSLLKAKMLRFPRIVQTALMMASCLGGEFCQDLLQEIVTDDLQRPLEIAEAAGLIRLQAELTESINIDNCTGACYDGDSKSLRWRFTHDQIQHTAYSLIPADEVNQLHLQIGRKLWNALDGEQLEQHLLVVVNQIRLGAHLIVEPQERERVSLLLLHAGGKCSSSSAFDAAISHFALAIQLLNPRHWRDQYHLSLDLYNAAAEVEYCNANFERMDALIADVLANARTVSDKARAWTNLMYSLGSRNELQRAIDLGFACLRELGEIFPAKASIFGILRELMRTKRMLRRISDDELLSLPLMDDPCKLAASRIMILLWSYTVGGRKMYAPLVAMRIVQNSLTQGISGISGAGFGALAVLFCNGFNEMEVGFRLASLGLQLLDKFNAKEWLGRIYCSCYGFCYVFREPLKDQLQRLLVAHRTSLATGDVEFSMLAGAFYGAIGLTSSVPLSKLSADCKVFLELMRIHKQSNMLQFLRPTAQLMLNLQGNCPDPLELNGDAMLFNEALNEAHATENNTIIMYLPCVILFLMTFFGRFQDGEVAAIQLSKYDTSHDFPCYIASWRFTFEGIAILETYRGSHRRTSLARKRMTVARSNLKMLKALTRQAPCNFAHLVDLLEAEFDVSKCRLDSALLKFDSCITRAQQSMRWSEVGLANERAAAALRRVGRNGEALARLNSAMEAYERWGASAKVRQLQSTLNDG